MARGDMDEATAILESVGEPPSDDTRDTYLIHAVRVGIARRTSDTGALAEAWAAARTVVAETSVDLFHLLALGSCWSAQRVCRTNTGWRRSCRKPRRSSPDWDSRALWSAAFHWYGVQAAMISERPDLLMPHADAISEAALVSRHAQTLASAGRTWLRVLQRDVDLTAITEAVHGLSGIGLTWDASQLAAKAALHSSDRRVSLDLLTFGARRPQRSRGDVHIDALAVQTELTDREWEIARLVVQGFGYREIGERLFISPRTVEHHIASVRRRLGVSNRAEMMDTLRRLLEGSSAAEAQ